MTLAREFQPLESFGCLLPDPGEWIGRCVVQGCMQKDYQRRERGGRSGTGARWTGLDHFFLCCPCRMTSTKVPDIMHPTAGFQYIIIAKSLRTHYRKGYFLKYTCRWKKTMPGIFRIYQNKRVFYGSKKNTFSKK